MFSVNSEPRIELDVVTDDNPLVRAIREPIIAAEKMAWDERGDFQPKNRRGIRAQQLMLENMGTSLYEFGFVYEDPMDQGRFICMDRFKYPIRLIPCRGRKLDGTTIRTNRKGAAWLDLIERHNFLFSEQILLIPPQNIGAGPYFVNLMVVSEVYKSHVSIHVALPDSRSLCRRLFHCSKIQTIEKHIDLSALDTVTEHEVDQAEESKIIITLEEMSG